MKGVTGRGAGAHQPIGPDGEVAVGAAASDLAAPAPQAERTRSRSGTPPAGGPAGDAAAVALMAAMHAFATGERPLRPSSDGQVEAIACERLLAEGDGSIEAATAIARKLADPLVVRENGALRPNAGARPEDVERFRGFFARLLADGQLEFLLAAAEYAHELVSVPDFSIPRGPRDVMTRALTNGVPSDPEALSVITAAVNAYATADARKVWDPKVAGFPPPVDGPSAKDQRK